MIEETSFTDHVLIRSTLFDCFYTLTIGIILNSLVYSDATKNTIKAQLAKFVEVFQIT